MAKSELKKAKIVVPYTEAETENLEITVGAPGHVEVGAGDGEKFVEGTVEYNVEEWMPRVKKVGTSYRIEQAKEWSDRVRFNFEAENRWNLTLGKAKPFALKVNGSVGQAHWALGGLPLTALTINSGVSDSVYAFDAPNPEVMRAFHVNSGVEQVKLDGLLNANFEQLEIKGGVGQMTLRFTGEMPDHDMRVVLRGGVGQTTITVAEGLAARLMVKGLAGVSASSAFSNVGSSPPFGTADYRTAGYDEAEGPKLEIDIATGVGAVSIKTV